MDRGDVEILAKDTVYKGYFQIDRYRLRHRTFDGGWTREIVREIFERGHAVAVLLYDPITDVVGLIEQFRTGAYAAGLAPWLIETVAGIIEEGESPDEVARREVTEETGCTVLDLEFISDSLISAGGSSETVRLYCGRVDASTIAGVHGLEHEGEDIRVFAVPLDEAVAMVKSGRITNSVAMISLLWLVTERERLRAKWR